MNIKKGIKFQCQGSGNCCVSRGSYGFVYLSKNDVNRLAHFINLKTKDFIEKYCDYTNGFLHLKENNANGDCQFLKDKKCSVYRARPIQCRTWPFWNENLNAKNWNNNISKFCPGIGKGKIYSKEEINKILKKDEVNEKNILTLYK
tara:strand:+ start:803 stop:1240 length:438 start_codon:yes stop_codon:yes gene_type:complete